MRSAQNIRNTDVANDTFTKGMPRQNSDDKPHDTKYPKADNTIAADWSVRRYRLGAQGLVWIEFRFPIEGGERGRIVVANSQLRHASKLLDDFANYSPIYPTTVGTTDDQRVQFLRNLVAACNRPLELIPDRTGFFDPCTFVTRSEILRSDGSRGPRCRLFDIAVPEPSKGGIFDRLSGIGQSSRQAQRCPDRQAGARLLKPSRAHNSGLDFGAADARLVEAYRRSGRRICQSCGPRRQWLGTALRPQIWRRLRGHDAGRRDRRAAVAGGPAEKGHSQMLSQSSRRSGRLAPLGALWLTAALLSQAWARSVCRHPAGRPTMEASLQIEVSARRRNQPRD